MRFALRRLGFFAVGNEFVLPASGPHYVMIKDLGERP